jgi:hypothetical protein
MENSHEYLTDLELAEIERFNANPILVDAVKKVLFSVINQRGVVKKGKKPMPLHNGALGLVSLAVSGRAVITDEQLGQDLRAYYHAVGLLESGFQDLAKIKVVQKEEKEEVNEAI